VARTRTVTELIADVRYRANIEGETARHSDANIQRLINESWQELRELISDAGYPYYLKAKSGALTPGPVVPDAASDPNLTAGFGTLPLPTDCLRVYGVDLEIDGVLVELEPLAFERRNAYQVNGSRVGRPIAFYPYNMGQEATTTVAAGALAILPAPESNYKYTLWYLPVWTDIATTSVFNGFASAEQWVIWDVCVKVTARDNDRQAIFAIAQAERAREAERIQTMATAQRAGPRRVHDTRSRRMRRNFTEPWRLP
jgi:hypothetical protein